jgi:hypothetical protein
VCSHIFSSQKKIKTASICTFCIFSRSPPDEIKGHQRDQPAAQPVKIMTEND